MDYGAELPISNAEADAAFERLLRFDHVVLAVSGGPDSMALLVLAAEWRMRLGERAPPISVATIDHGLRPESAAEAVFVGKAAQSLGLEHVVFLWSAEKPATGLAEAARDARYRRLDDEARTRSSRLSAVATAHHLDDQAETFAMRLARGAGVEGLAAMRPERTLFEGSPVTLVRPLLEFPKSRLRATVMTRGLGFVEDPTNEDLRYERPRVREALIAFEAAGISANALANSARRLGDAKAALRYAEETFVATLDLAFGNEIFASFDRKAFADGPMFLQQKVLTDLIARFGGESPRPGLSEVENLASRLQEDSICAATLGGAMISAGRRLIRVWREPGRLDQREIRLSPGESRIWDRRFVIRLVPENAGSVLVRPLGAENYAKISRRLATRPPARAAHALPSFWVGSELLAIPSLAPFAVEREPPFEPAGIELRPLAAADL